MVSLLAPSRASHGITQMNWSALPLLQERISNDSMHRWRDTDSGDMAKVARATPHAPG